MRRKDHPFRAIFRTDPFGWTKFKNERRGFGHVGALHKGAIEERPYRFTNEIISGSIAQFLRLPIPPFSVTEFLEQDDVDLKNEFLFSSLDFNYERDSSPLPDFDACVKRLGPLCAGVLLFDILVANSDRTKDNLWADDEVLPRRMLIYDHDAALFGFEGEGADRLKAVENDLGLCFWSPNREPKNDHPFLKRIPSSTLFYDWYKKIITLPEWFVRDVCSYAIKIGEITKDDARRAAQFILYRSRNLEEIVRRHHNEFSAINDWNQEGLFQ